MTFKLWEQKITSSPIFDVKSEENGERSKEKKRERYRERDKESEREIGRVREG